MLRVLFDDHGSSTKNLFVKIDGRPSRVYVVDTSWLGDFLDSDETPIHTEDELILAKRAGVASLIRLWETILLSDQPICYLPYDLSDQYVGVLQVIKRKKLYRISRL